MYFQDIYEDISVEKLMYTTENIPTFETEEDFDEIFTEGCKCKNVCSLESNCSCLLKYGINYKINCSFNVKNTHDVLHTNYLLNTEKTKYGLYECNSNCSCKNKSCGNRLVQYGPRNHLQITNCAEKGFGLMTTQKILKETFICEYAGEVISKSEAVKRFKDNKDNNSMNYILCVREHFGDKSGSTFIDPSVFGNIGRFLNHSCNPNCELIPVRIDCIVPKLCIFAKKDIEQNCELTFDYGDGSNDIINDKELKKCLCGEENCRNWMPYNASVGK